MSKANQWQSDLLKLFLQNIAAAGIGDAGGLLPSATAGSLYVSLHTADPGAAGLQNTSECSYTGYARVAVVRSASGWTVAGSNPTSGSNAAAVTFPQSTSGPQTATYYGIGDASSGATKLRYSGLITSPVAGLVINPSITPSFAIGTATVTEI